MDNLYFVLRYPLSGKEVSSLMCRVVADPQNPNRKFIPNSEEPDPLSLSSILPNLLPDPIPVESSAAASTASNTSLKAHLQKLLSFSSESTAQRNMELRAEIKRYTLSQNEWKFKKLVQDGRFAKEVTGLVNENGGKAYMVSGFMTCRESSWRRGIEQNQHTVPAASVTSLKKQKEQEQEMEKDRDWRRRQRAYGDPGHDDSAENLRHYREPEARDYDDAGISRDVQKRASHGSHGDINETLVFAIAYDVIGTQWYFDWNESYFPRLKTKVALKTELKSDWSQLSMRPDGGEEDEILEEDGEENEERRRASVADLMLVEMSKEEFERCQRSNPE